MKISTVLIDNFMSFGPGEMINLADRGLLLLEGVNEAASSASSNGAGKTNLMEAIAWCLFGKTSKEVAADEVVNNQVKKDCRVQVYLEDGKELYYVARFRKHKDHGNELLFKKVMAHSGEEMNLTGVDMAETQKKIEDFLGCSFTLFCNSIYCSQQNLRPFSLFTDKQIKEVFMEALDLGRFMEALTNVRAEKSSLDAEISKLFGRQARLDEELSEAKKRLESYTANERNFESDKLLEIKRLGEEISRCQEALDRSEKETAQLGDLETRRVDLTRRVAELPGLKERLKDAEVKSKPLRDNWILLDQRLNDTTRDKKGKEAEIANVSKKIGTDCKACGKRIEPEDVEKVLAALREELTGLEEKRAALLEIEDKAAPVIGTLVDRQRKIATQIESVESLQRELFGLQTKIEGLKASIRAAKLAGSEKPRWEDLLKAKKKEVSPFKPLIKNEADRILEIEKEKKKVAVSLDENEVTMRYLYYWEQAFGYGGIPSFLLDAVVPFLNEKSNHYAAVASEGEIQIEFSTMTRTKKAVKDKFAINVQHVNGAKEYKGVSGGERKRADVCVTQAMQDLVRFYGKNPIEIAFYDEPFEHLDGEGVSGVVDMLEEVAKEIPTVLVVTHNSEMKSLFSRSIQVRKGEDGFSHIMD
jgi:DNA repair exonuclease SbcCD ATPase subunit